MAFTQWKNEGKDLDLLPPDFEPGEWDVICQRGKECYDHEGNRRFRHAIERNLDRYLQVKSRQEKSSMVSNIVETIRVASATTASSSSGGGFVKKDLATRRWYRVRDKIAREKAGQALRDAIKTRRAVDKKEDESAAAGGSSPKKRIEESEPSRRIQRESPQNDGHYSLQKMNQIDYWSDDRKSTRDSVSLSAGQRSWNHDPPDHCRDQKRRMTCSRQGEIGSSAVSNSISHSHTGARGDWEQASSIFDRQLSSELEPRPLSTTSTVSHKTWAATSHGAPEPASNNPWFPGIAEYSVTAGRNNVEASGRGTTDNMLQHRLSGQNRLNEESDLLFLRYLLQESCESEQIDDLLARNSFSMSRFNSSSRAPEDRSYPQEANTGSQNLFGPRDLSPDRSSFSRGLTLPYQPQTEQEHATNRHITSRFEQQILPTIFDSESFMKMGRGGGSRVSGIEGTYSNPSCIPAWMWKINSSDVDIRGTSDTLNIDSLSQNADQNVDESTTSQGADTTTDH